MSIFSRIGDIINSNINAMLDRAENPEKMIRNIIQEMEDTLVEVRSQAAKSIADKKQMQRNLQNLTQKQKDWEEKASLALSRDREDLAKGALFEKSKLADACNELEQQLVYLDEDVAKYNDDIVVLQEKITEARSRQLNLVRRHKIASSQLKVRSNTHSNKLDRMLQQMDQLERRADLAEGHVEAHDLGKQQGLTEQISELEADEQVKKELDALKAKLNKEVNK